MAQTRRSLPEPMARHLAQLVRAERERRHPTPANGRPVSQARVAREIKIAQGVLSDILAANGGVGVAALLALRAWLGISIDELLGLPPPTRQDALAPSEDARLLREEVATMRADIARVERLALAKTHSR